MSASVEPRPQAPRKGDEVASIVFGAAIAVLALVYMFVPHLGVLIAWETVAVVYIVLLLVRFRNRATRHAPVSTRALPGRLLEYLAWVLPIAASVTGVAAAVTLLTTEARSEGGGVVLIGVLGSLGVVIAWFLLQAGFAEIYESVHERLPAASMITFPGVGEDPTLGDFLYLSFTVGTSFAVSGATIASRKVRRVILIHSVTSFFYNAFLIAIAIQVVQGIIRAS